jgi:hypothetical protein
MAMLWRSAALKLFLDRGFEEQRLSLKDQFVHEDDNV